MESNQVEDHHEDYFSFLNESKEEENSFFLDKGLEQTIVELTQAKPDIPLMACYAIYHTLVKSHPDEFQGSWNALFRMTGFFRIGACFPPEKLLDEDDTFRIQRMYQDDNSLSSLFANFSQTEQQIDLFESKIYQTSFNLPHKTRILEALRLIRVFYSKFKQEVRQYTREEAWEKLQAIIKPKAILILGSYSGNWAYRIPRHTALKILSRKPQERLAHSVITEMAIDPVSFLPNDAHPLVLFKSNRGLGDNPQNQHCILHSLYRHLYIPTPESKLLFLSNVDDDQPYQLYTVQASEAVLGVLAESIMENQGVKWDAACFSQQVIGALLTNPLGRLRNYVYNRGYKGVIKVETETFEEEERKENEEMSNSLFQMHPMKDRIPYSIQKSYKGLDIELTVLAWLKDLCQQNQAYKTLRSHLLFQVSRLHHQSPNVSLSTQEILQRVENEKIRELKFTPIRLSSGRVENIRNKLQRIKKVLQDYPNLTLKTLWEKVISCFHPSYLEPVRVAEPNPLNAQLSFSGTLVMETTAINLDQLRQNEPINGEDDRKDPEYFYDEFKERLKGRETSPLDYLIAIGLQSEGENPVQINKCLKDLSLLIQGDFINFKSANQLAEFLHNFEKRLEKRSDKKQLNNCITSLLEKEPRLRWNFFVKKYFLPIDSGSIVSGLVITKGIMTGECIPTDFFRREIVGRSDRHFSYSFISGRSKLSSLYDNDKLVSFFKKYPNYPGNEYGYHKFLSLLNIPYLPQQDFLLLITNQEVIPIMLTEAVYGEPVYEVWDNDDNFENLDPYHTYLQIICAMLLNPEEHKEDRFILTDNKKFLVPVDVDNVFLPGIIRKKENFWNEFLVYEALQTKSILLCLKQVEKEIPESVKAIFRDLDIEDFLRSWLKSLAERHLKHQNLVGDLNPDLFQTFLKHGTNVGIYLTKEFIETLYWKLKKIQSLMKKLEKPTPLDLLKVVEPFVYEFYQASFRNGNSLKERFKVVIKDLHTQTSLQGSRVSLNETHKVIEISSLSKNEIQAKNKVKEWGMNEIIEHFESIIRNNAQSQMGESNKDDFIFYLDQKSNKEKVLGIFEKDITKRYLLDFLKNPKEGFSLVNSLFDATKLKEFFSETKFNGEILKFLSLTDSPALDNQVIELLVKECPNLEYLNVSGCPKLQKIVPGKDQWKNLIQLEARKCEGKLEITSYSPIKILHVESDSKVTVNLEKICPDIMTITKRYGYLSTELTFSQKDGLRFKSHKQDLSDYELVLMPNDDLKYFPLLKVKSNSISNKAGLIAFILETGSELKALDILWNCLLKKTLTRQAILQWKEIFSSSKFLQNTGVGVFEQGPFTLLNSLKLNLGTVKEHRDNREILLREENKGSTTMINPRDITGMVGSMSLSFDGDNSYNLLLTGKSRKNDSFDLFSISLTQEEVKLDQKPSQKAKLEEITKDATDELEINVLASRIGGIAQQRYHLWSVTVSHLFRKMMTMKRWMGLQSLKTSFGNISEDSLEFNVSAKLPLFNEVVVCWTKMSKDAMKFLVKNSVWEDLQYINQLSSETKKISFLNENLTHFQNIISILNFEILYILFEQQQTNEGSL